MQTCRFSCHLPGAADESLNGHVAHPRAARPTQRTGLGSTLAGVAHDRNRSARPHHLRVAEPSLAEDPNQEPVFPVVQLLIVAVLVFLGLTVLVLWMFHG
jgi:hypothetical protein